MHNNYYFLRQLSVRLHQELQGKLLLSCFSQNKDELIMGFASDEPPHEEFYIKALLDSRFSCLHFPGEFHRSKRNSVDLFQDAIDKKVKEVRQLENERSFCIIMEGDERAAYYQFLFKMHGRHANLLWLAEKKVEELFKHQIVKDQALNIDELPREIDHSYENFLRHKTRPNKMYPTLGPLPPQYLEEQGYESASEQEKWQMLNELLETLNKAEKYYITEVNGDLELSLLPLGKIQEQHEEPLTALNHYFQRYVRDLHLHQEKGLLIRMISKKISQTENYIQKNHEKLEELQSGTGYSQLADIIMANMHQFSPGERKMVLHNFYTNSPIEIKLKPNISPQKQAEQLYRKAKRQKIEIEQLRQNIDNKEAQLLRLYEHLEFLENSDNIRSIRQYAKEHELQRQLEEKTESVPFKSFTIQGFQVLVGKSARDNDDMLREFSYKEDLWLHAKDVSGSHVLIKYQAGRQVPKIVIERAAQLAAFYSKRKTDSLCPVSVTPRKFVRKSKNLLPGQVIVEKEEVVLVEPKGPADL
ncbi:MAG: NFACT RNA binding domain-containing protein [Cyclobacteriaceae bacterium]